MLKTNKTLVLLAMVLTCMSCSKKAQETKAPVRVKTETTSTAGTYGGEKYVGIVEEREATSVSFTSMGVVRRMLVSEGQMVSRGQLLAELDPTSMDNSVEAAKASTSQAHDMVAQARNTYDQAKDAYDRMKLLHDNGSLPEIKWIEAETRLKQAETALHTAESGVRSATAAERIVRKNLSDTRLYAPVPGIIGRKQVGAGETALPSQSVGHRPSCQRWLDREGRAGRCTHSHLRHPHTRIQPRPQTATRHGGQRDPRNGRCQPEQHHIACDQRSEEIRRHTVCLDHITRQHCTSNTREHRTARRQQSGHYTRPALRPARGSGRLPETE